MTKRSFPLAWLLGAALLALVVGAALHVSDSREFVVVAERAGPWWMALAVVLQLGTYVAQGNIWRRVAAAARAPLPRLAIVACDAATMWVLLRSIGVTAGVETVFASFMVSSLVRTLGVVPGGLGTFEATSVVTLTLTGATVAQALSATLLFRGLSFWIPMLPALWFSRRLTAPPTAVSDLRWTQ